jgi:hypothetical protein
MKFKEQSLELLGTTKNLSTLRGEKRGEELGRDFDVREFAAAISQLLESDMVQFWRTDARTGDRTEMYVPSLIELDTLDPAELTLGLGPNVDKDGPPRWRIHVDFTHHSFLVEADASCEKQAVRRMCDGNPGSSSALSEESRSAADFESRGRHSQGTGRSERRV